jgi:hypothetical protein
MPTRRMTTAALSILALSAALVACAKNEPKAAEAPKAAPAGASSAPAEGAAKAPGAPELSGTILETMDAGGYTYLKLKTASGEAWAAVNQAKVKVGDPATVLGGMPMDNFESPTLKRKFDRIYFGVLAGAAPPAGAAGAPAAPAGVMPEAAHATAADAKPGTPMMPPGHADVKKAPVDETPIKVEKASGAEGKTVAELFSQKASLKGKPVAVRGKVVKFLPDIMGKNWVHVRDGSGSAKDKNNDLTVTTKEKVAVGDVVVVRGTLLTDKDLGAGYEFPVIVEDAKFTK